MYLYRHILFASLPIAAFGAQKRATPSSFQLFAYGDGIGGLPMIYSSGYAYIGDPNLVNSSDAASVVFSSGTDNSWTGAPNTTGLVNGTTPDWSNVTLFVPESGGRVGFLNGENSTAGNAVITSFVFYGSTAMAIGDDGDLDSLWYGLPVGDTGVHQLYWNDTTQGQVPVVVRSIGPSNPNDRRR